MASLTFQAFYEAKYGEVAWQQLDKIPKEEWMAYLVWYRWAAHVYPAVTQTQMTNQACLLYSFTSAGIASMRVLSVLRHRHSMPLVWEGLAACMYTSFAYR